MTRRRTLLSTKQSLILAYTGVAILIGLAIYYESIISSPENCPEGFWECKVKEPQKPLAFQMLIISSSFLAALILADKLKLIDVLPRKEQV